jgi:hypothetical protein
MATFIQQLASMSQQLAIVSDPKNTVPFNPGVQRDVPKRLVPPHVEALKPYQPGRPPEQLKKELGIERFVNMASNENPTGTTAIGPGCDAGDAPRDQPLP